MLWEKLSSYIVVHMHVTVLKQTWDTYFLGNMQRYTNVKQHFGFGSLFASYNVKIYVVLHLQISDYLYWLLSVQNGGLILGFCGDMLCGFGIGGLILDTATTSKLFTGIAWMYIQEHNNIGAKFYLVDMDTL